MLFVVRLRVWSLLWFGLASCRALRLRLPLRQPFAEICPLTDVLEGTIVRCITRLDETCRDVRNAARVIGDPQLYQKMELASTCIKRDIVFAASLYVT